MDVTLEDLKKRLDDSEKETEELRAAYKVMVRLSGSSPSSHANTEDMTVPSLSETGAINLDELDLPTKKVVKSGTSLYANVKSLIERFGNQEFTVNHVDVALRKMGKGSTAKHFKNRVSITIRKLAEEGVVERTHKGAGNEPHKYRLARKVSLVKHSSTEG